MAGLPASYREWWDLGDGYEIYVDIGENCCVIAVDALKEKEITLEVAKYLGVDTTADKIVPGAKANGRELYLSVGIDCVVMKHTKPKDYKKLLKKIEEIVNEHFKGK